MREFEICKKIVHEYSSTEISATETYRGIKYWNKCKKDKIKCHENVIWWKRCDKWLWWIWRIECTWILDEKVFEKVELKWILWNIKTE